MSEQKLSQGLDFYKPTMSQLEFEQYPDAEVTFTMKNRSDNPLSRYVRPEQLKDRIETLQSGWQPDEIAYLASLEAQDGSARFTPEYLDYLADSELPPLTVRYGESGDLDVSTTGKWPLVSFWETVVMSELNELYYEGKIAQEGLSVDQLYAEGNRRLDTKIELLRSRPDIKFSDFGTRRRFSYQWHRHVLKRLASECPDNFVGTSNVFLSHELGLRPIGTFAHELPMGYAALAEERGDNPLSGHSEMLHDWQAKYGSDLSTALTDTFTTGFFFADFSPEQAQSWNSLRHDSGDPIEFGEAVINFYERSGVDSRDKTIVFSDGLDIDKIVQLADYFKGRINTTYGWGTTLTNDLGLEPNNFVMKATKVNGIPTVKLSDSVGKHTGPEDVVDRYQSLVAQSLKAVTA